MEFVATCAIMCVSIASSQDYSPDIPGDIYTILFGNLAELNNFFYLSPDEQTTLRLFAGASGRRAGSPKEEFSDPSHFDYLFDSLSKDFNYDVRDFNESNTRRGLVAYSKTPYDSRDYFEAGKNYKEWEQFEEKKILKVRDVNRQFLVHARYKISFALLQREPMRKDVRYQLGYLFNKLKRLHLYEKNIVNMAKRHYFWEGTDAAAVSYKKRKQWMIVLRLYERMIHLDVDVKDVINTMRKLKMELQDEYSEIQEFIQFQNYMNDVEKKGDEKKKKND